MTNPEQKPMTMRERRARSSGAHTLSLMPTAAPPFNRALAVAELRAKARAGCAVTISDVFARLIADQLEKDGK